jgi:hypothetical protein
MTSYRKRLGSTSSSNPKCHAEAFPIKASDHPRRMRQMGNEGRSLRKMSTGWVLTCGGTAEPNHCPDRLLPTQSKRRRLHRRQLPRWNAPVTICARRRYSSRRRLRDFGVSKRTCIWKERGMYPPLLVRTFFDGDQILTPWEHGRAPLRLWSRTRDQLPPGGLYFPIARR